MKIKFMILCMALIVFYFNNRAHAEGISTRIINGGNANEGEFPWIAALYYINYLNPSGPDSQPDRGQFCGGALIAPNYVVTAAHCVSSYGRLLPVDEFRVVIGRNTLKSDTGVISDVDAIIIHPQYDAYNAVNDIALLRLKNDIPITPLGIISDYETNFWQPGDISTIMGYGISKLNDGKGSFVLPNTLQKANIPIISDQQCENIYERAFHSDAMLCAGILSSSSTSEDGVDSCFGDSGGPLVVKTNRGYKLVGIVSFGNSKNCISDIYPGVYAKVAKFLSWIRSSPKATPFIISNDSPTIDGEPELGSNLKCNSVELGGDSIDEYRYQWFITKRSSSIGAKIIDGATGENYIVNAPLGNYLACRVTASNSGGSVTLESNIIGPVRDSLAPNLSLINKSCSKKGCKVSISATDDVGLASIFGNLSIRRCYHKKCRQVSIARYSPRFDGVIWNFSLPRIRGEALLSVTAEDVNHNVSPSLDVKLRGR